MIEFKINDIDVKLYFVSDEPEPSQKIVLR